MLNPPIRNIALMGFTENKLFYFSKRALRAGSARNKWLKEALNMDKKLKILRTQKIEDLP